MSKIGERFTTGQTCNTSGSYVFDGYTEGPSTPQPSAEEREISLHVGYRFPPIRSTNRGAFWKLQRLQ